MSASGRAAAEGVKRRAQRAKTALREAGEDLARAPAVRTPLLHATEMGSFVIWTALLTNTTLLLRSMTGLSGIMASG